MVAARLIKFFKKYFDGIVLFFYPLFLILLNSNWIFTPAILSPDPWFYFSFFRYFDTYAPAFPSNTHYFVERLTWNVPGFYLYKIFSPELANYILHLLVYYAAVFSLYGILKLLFTRRTAFVSAILMGSYPWFLRAVGWDYVDGVGIAHLLFLFFLLTLSVRSQHWKLILFFGGMVHASLLITNQFWLGFAPAWIAFFLLLSFKNNKFTFSRLLQAGIFIIIGNLILTVVVSLYYHGVTGEYNFLKNSVAFSQRITSDEQNVRDVLKFYGQMPPYWHILPMLFTLFGIRQLFNKQRVEHHYELLIVIIAYLLSYLWLIYWHIFKIPYLSVYLYSSYIIPATFLLIGALIYPVFERLSEQQYQRLILPMLLIMAAPLFLITIIPSFGSLQRNMWIFAGITIGVFIAFTMLHKKAVLLFFLTGISLMFYQSAASYDIGVYTPDRSLNKNNFNTLIEASDEIDTYYPDHKYSDFRLWFRADGNMITQIPLASIYLYPWGSSINMYFTDRFEWPENVQLKDGNIVLITANPDSKQVIDEANNALMPYNAELNFESSKRIDHGNLGITLTFTNLEIKPMQFDFGKKYEFDYQPSNGQNWQLPENDGKSFMWSGPGSKSDLPLVLPSSESDIKVQFCVISSLKPSTLTSLKLIVNENTIPITSTKSSDCPYLYSGIIQSKIISANPKLSLVSFQVDETVSPNDLKMSSDERKLGLAFDWLIFERVK